MDKINIERATDWAYCFIHKEDYPTEAETLNAAKALWNFAAAWGKLGALMSANKDSCSVVKEIYEYYVSLSETMGETRWSR